MDNNTDGKMTADERAALAARHRGEVMRRIRLDPMETPIPLCTFDRAADMSLPCPACSSDGGDCSFCKGTVMRRVPVAVTAEAVAARDAEWRAAVERVRVRATALPTDNAIERAALGLVHSTLDALLAAMEVPHDGQ